MTKAEKAFNDRFKKKSNGTYKYKPKAQVMFSKDVEEIFEKESKTKNKND